MLKVNLHFGGKMKYLFKGITPRFFQIPLYTILYALIAGGIWWFFASVIFQSDLSFLFAWKWSYLVLVGVQVVVDIVFPLFVRLIVGLYFSNRFKASFSDVLEASVGTDLFRKGNWKTMTPETFKIQLQRDRSMKQIADTVINNLFGR